VVLFRDKTINRLFLNGVVRVSIRLHGDVYSSLHYSQLTFANGSGSFTISNRLLNYVLDFGVAQEGLVMRSNCHFNNIRIGSRLLLIWHS
jgi:hypothetical protein